MPQENYRKEGFALNFTFAKGKVCWLLGLLEHQFRGLE